MARKQIGPDTFTIELDDRIGVHISNEQTVTGASQGACLQYDGKYPDNDLRVKHRGEASETYNCHGMVFASRRTAIPHIEKILRREAHEIDKRHVLPGDIIVYFSETGDAEHSGVVVELPKGFGIGVRVLSKWGSWREVLHWQYDCPYEKANTKFYRVDP